MKDERRRSTRIFFAVVAILLLTAAGVAVWKAASQSNVGEPVTQEDAEILLEETVAYAKAGDYDGLCRSLATEPSVCRQLAEDARAQAPSTGGAHPAVTGFTADAGQFSLNRVSVLHLRGTRADGTQYTSDFAVVRRPSEGGRQVSSLTPVYWSGVKYSAGQPCKDGEHQGDACGANTRKIAP
ncbi:hypothetical protein SK803_04170 [Lentzea sp. BCCO 10_0856]|uniref:Uncharacterized protein n=1 Tax=Lentzea miocenica TaxID=3095431 RepID=A0ABU4STZ9_9PSEU|nr:hypothetical protein [Lentzea sp. BCCO 10_0856]MDX8029390.1 hypothetical protein [Lentzea sp. BCCO 10_0856]